MDIETVKSFKFMNEGPLRQKRVKLKDWAPVQERNLNSKKK